MPRSPIGTRVSWLLLVAGFSLSACSGEEPQSFDLADGREVEVSSSGRVQLRVDGREVFAMAKSARPELRRFEERVVEALGIWDFPRSGQERTELGKLASAGVEGDSLLLVYSGETGDTRLRISPDGSTRTRVRLESDGEHASLAMPLACDEEASFYGFGAQYNALDQRGEAFPLFVSEQGIGRTGSPRALTGDAHTTYFPMPYFIDARGFGMLVDTARLVNVDLCKEDEDVAWIEEVGSEALELVVFHGPSAADVIAQLGEVVGRPARPPAWAFDLWISAQGGREAVLAEVDALEAAEIPVGVIWSQDWTGERINADGGKGVQYRWEVDAERYPDLGEMIDGLHDRGLRFLAYANPFIDPKLPNHFDEMAAADLLIHDAEGEIYVPLAPNGRSSQPDLTNPEARDYVEAAFRAMVTEHGIDGFMADFGEWLPVDAALADGDAYEEHNLYPVRWHQAWRNALDEVRPDGDFAVIARSGYTGVHAHSQIHWIGDQETDFSLTDGLPTVVPAMLNLGLSGIPFVTHDIGGFSSLDTETRSKELFLRWTELGAFTPIMRTHEGAFRDENWSWDRDAETTKHFRRFARIHQALAPELAALADEAIATGMPMVRPLFLHAPDDAIAKSISDSYMLGPDLLVAPVVEEGAALREVYLPEGEWFHLWTGDRYQGGEFHSVLAPFGEPPVFSRARDRSDLRAID